LRVLDFPIFDSLRKKFRLRVRSRRATFSLSERKRPPS
jgi:hypothetical protein